MSPTLDLESLILKSGLHLEQSREMCIMEAVAYVAGEPWSDHPTCASPVISAFLRSYNDLVSDQVRQTLKPFIPRLIGTAASESVERRRALMATDWMVRVHTPAWLRLAGLTADADALAGLPEITDTAQFPSIKAPLEAARSNANAAGAAAGAAAWDADWDAAWDAAREKLVPTVLEIQASIPALIERMIAAS